MFSRVYLLCTTFTFLKLLGWTVLHRTIVLLAHATTLQCSKVPFTYLYTPALVSHMYTCMQFLPIPPCHLQTLSLSLYTLRPKWLAMTFFILSTGRVVFSGGFSWVKSLILQTYKSSCLTHRHASIYFFEIHSLQWTHTCTHVPFFLIWFLLSYLQIDPSTHTGTEQTLHVDDVQVTILYSFHFNLDMYFINSLHATYNSFHFFFLRKLSVPILLPHSNKLVLMTFTRQTRCAHFHNTFQIEILCYTSTCLPNIDIT